VIETVPTKTVPIETVDIADPSMALANLFLGGAPLPAPSPPPESL